MDPEKVIAPTANLIDTSIKLAKLLPTLPRLKAGGFVVSCDCNKNSC